MKRYTLFSFFILGFSLIGCFDEELSYPQQGTATYTTTNYRILNGTVHNGFVFSGYTNVEYSNYFLNLSYKSKLAMANTSIFSTIANATDNIARQTDILENIHIKCTENAYTSSPVNSIIDEVLSIEFNGQKYSINEFNNLPSAMKMFDGTDVRIYFEMPPVKENKFRFAAILTINGVQYTVPTPAIFIS